MKFLPLFFLFAFSCENNKNVVKPQPNLSEQTDTTEIPESLPDVRGHWFSDDLLKKIEKTKSIYPHAGKISWFFACTISGSKDGNGLALAGYNEHEGGIDFQLKPYAGQYMSDPKKGDIIIDLLPTGLLHIKSSLYNLDLNCRKTASEDDEIRKILFEGKYKNAENGNLYSFKSNGDITGFGKSIYMEVVTDFTMGINYDAIMLYRERMDGRLWSEAVAYKYAINGKKLTLWPVTLDWEEMDHTVSDSAIVMQRI